MLPTHFLVHVTDNKDLQVDVGEEFLSISLQIFFRNS